MFGSTSKRHRESSPLLLASIDARNRGEDVDLVRGFGGTAGTNSMESGTFQTFERALFATLGQLL